MIVRKISKANETTIVETLDRSFGKPTTLHIPNEMFIRDFHKVKDVSQNTLGKQDIYKCNEKVKNKMLWWEIKHSEVGFLYSECYSKDINASTPLKLDMLNTIFEEGYKPQFGGNFFQFCEDCETFKGVFHG